MRKNFLKKAGLLSFCAALIMNVGTTFAAPTDVAVVQKHWKRKRRRPFLSASTMPAMWTTLRGIAT